MILFQPLLVQIHLHLYLAFQPCWAPQKEPFIRSFSLQSMHNLIPRRPALQLAAEHSSSHASAFLTLLFLLSSALLKSTARRHAG